MQYARRLPAAAIEIHKRERATAAESYLSPESQRLQYIVI